MGTMTRCSFLVFLVGMLVSILVSVSIAKSAGASRPHILVVIADDYGWNDIGYHSDELPTPILNSLASSGVKLNNYYVQPLCTPSRASFMTGRYPIRYGLQHFVIQPPFPAGLFLNETTMPQRMRESGYATHAIGKWHLGFFEWEYTPTYRGFDSYLGYWTGGESYYNHVPDGSNYVGYDFHNGTKDFISGNGTYSSTWFADEAERVVRNYAKDTSTAKKPLFMYLAMQTCHEPLVRPPQPNLDRCAHLQDENRKIFCTMTSNLDDTVGAVVKSFQTAGIWEDTLLVFSTDNGAHPQLGGSNWPLRGGKGTLFEGGVRGAAFVAGAGVPKALAGTINNELMHITDWFPTLLGVAGANSSNTFPLDGKDQWKTITQKNASSPREEILLNIDLETASIRVGHMKLVVNNQSYDGWWYPPVNSTENKKDGIHVPVTDAARAIKMDDGAEVCLFNVTADPNETRNLAKENLDQVKELRTRIEEYRSGRRGGFVHPWMPPSDPKADPTLHGGMWVPWKSLDTKHIST